MSNTYKIIIAAIAVTVLGATSIFIIGQNRQEDKPVIPQSLSAVSSVKSMVISSSSQSQISSSPSIVAQSLVATSNKAESEITRNSSINFQNCETLIGTDSIQVDGKCIGIGYGYDASFIWKNSFMASQLTAQQQDELNMNRLYETPQNKKILKEMAVDFYNKFKSSQKLPNIIGINFASSKKTQNGFEIGGGVQASGVDHPFGFIPISATYLIYQDSSNNWTWKFISIENNL